MAESLVDGRGCGELRQTHARFQNAASSRRQPVTDVKHNQDETVFMHEHPHFAVDPDRALSFVASSQVSGSEASRGRPENLTKIPDSILLHPGTVPLFTIRHPALTIPAGYEAMRNLEKTLTRPNVLLVSTLAWHRELYEWYLSNGITPIVAEAEDYMSSKEYVRGLAAKAGLSPDDCIFQWEKVSEDEQKKMNKMYVILQQTLINSEGMVEGKAKRQVDLEKEYERWVKVHGNEEEAFLRELVERSMADYEYLKGKKFRIET